MKQCLRKSRNLASLRSSVARRGFVSSSRFLQHPSESLPQQGQAINISQHKTSSTIIDNVSFTSRDPVQDHGIGFATTIPSQQSDVGLFIDDQPYKFKAVLLRDICECESCLDSSTKQKLFSTTDIPTDIQARAVAQTENGTSILWNSDIPGFGPDHTTEISADVLRNIAHIGYPEIYTPGPAALWDAEMFSKLPDVDYEAYMQDDSILYQALHQLHTYGLLFVSNVPESENSVSTIGERIGPIKNTFYGYTWDVRSVPEAKNVAYTSQDLGFHMDLMYMHQPPHLQLLHCIRSSAKGGASLFTDSFRAAQELFMDNPGAFEQLAATEQTFHYNHPSSHLYRQLRRVFEMRDLIMSNGMPARNIEQFMQDVRRRPQPFNIVDWIKTIAWSPPFQGPFSLRDSSDATGRHSAIDVLNERIGDWHFAATEYSKLLHRSDGIYERLMRPGECVVFDNRRVLHARSAFEVGDAGTERWLRGAYLDEDPYVSKLRVLQHRFGDTRSTLNA